MEIMKDSYSLINFEVLDRIMSEKGLTYASLERAAGIANGSIGKWKEHPPRVGNFEKVADVLGCTLEELVIRGSGRRYMVEDQKRAKSKLPEEDKREWLRSIGAVEFETPVKYTYGFQGYAGCFNLSEEYVRDTPLKELKKKYEESRAYAKAMLSNERPKDTFCPHDLRNAGCSQENPLFPEA